MQVEMDPIRVNAKFSHVPPSTLAEFKRAAAQAQDLTKREPGALQYDWFFNDDQTVCIVHEAYVDSAAVTAHIGNLGDVFGKLLETDGGCSFEVFGNPSRELRDAVSGLDLTVFAHFQGK
jgi:quinol monooxygenase YgiN